MRGVIKLGLILVPILLVLGLVLNAIYKVRDYALVISVQKGPTPWPGIGK